MLVTAPEILFFWVARMIMAGIEFMAEIPFEHVYIHGTVRDLTGKKMSKSLGNIIDPIDIIDEFGADALRYSIIAITATGQDVFLSMEKFEIGRNFANKIWNASRFVMMNIPSPLPSPQWGEGWVRGDLNLADQWILSKINKTITAVTEALENYRFNDGESIIYDFFWHEFCDWYVEMVKPDIIAKGKGHRAKSGEVLIYVLETSLKLLHPFMPFVTEAVWQGMRGKGSIMVEGWPVSNKLFIQKGIERRMETIKEIIVSIRNIRSDMDIPYSKKLRAYLAPLKKNGERDLEGGTDYIRNLAHLEELIISKDVKRPGHCATSILEGFNMFIPLEGVIDIGAEKARLSKKMQDLEAQLNFSKRKLDDHNFITKAPKDVIEIEREKSQNLTHQIKRLQETLKSL